MTSRIHGMLGWSDHALAAAVTARPSGSIRPWSRLNVLWVLTRSWTRVSSILSHMFIARKPWRIVARKPWTHVEIVIVHVGWTIV